ncbi:uncharacterized protein LOC119668058 [Teleopsis dalmanni]|uniref:uncharacterized protein LOC119668058 n=1 Tax=Teleopsis dalmanni TaxID=139649 RepID=UPI0018CE5ECC|nr:uncharacterized protein LOC119668058 [Teleopsis dalmanni]
MDAKEQKNVSKEKQVNSSPTIKYFPILLCDVKRLNLSENAQCVYTAFDGTVKFKFCIVYARILRSYTPNKLCDNYLIDDGTAVIRLGIVRRKEAVEATSNMKNELQALKESTTSEITPNIAESLERILDKTIQLLDTSQYQLGTKLIICGTPQMYRGNIELKAHTVHEDVGLSRNLEIAFKDHLIEWYNKTKLKQKPTT